MNERDLNALDRRTLRAWRASNLAGWGCVASLAYFLTSLAGVRLLFSLGRYVPFWPLWFAIPIVSAGFVAGSIVGAKVYRSPALVSIGSVFASIVPSYLWITRDGRAIGWPIELLAWAVPMALGAILSAFVATRVFRRRPSALRRVGGQA